MAFCNNCGTELPDGARFCHVCGKPVNKDNNEYTQRKQVFEGSIHKCPNCGESVASFQRNCPTCGFEFREVQSSKALKDFANKLARVEASRTERRVFGLFGKSQRDIIRQKIDIIQNYPVPNSKEDMLEFMVLATSNVDPSVYEKSARDTSERDLCEAWLAKAKQVYDKARSSYGIDADSRKIKDLYLDCEEEVLKIKRIRKRKDLLKNIATYGWLPVLFAILIVALIIQNKNTDASEEVRLGEMVNVVESAIEKHEYKYALRNAESMEYNGNDKEREKWWNIQRATLVDRVILEAGKEGIYLEPSPTPTIEPTSTPSSQLDKEN